MVAAARADSRREPCVGTGAVAQESTHTHSDLERKWGDRGAPRKEASSRFPHRCNCSGSCGLTIDVRPGTVQWAAVKSSRLHFSFENHSQAPSRQAGFRTRSGGFHSFQTSAWALAICGDLARGGEHTSCNSVLRHSAMPDIVVSTGKLDCGAGGLDMKG